MSMSKRLTVGRLRHLGFLARARAYATMSVSVCLSVRLSAIEMHCGHGACREEGRGHLALR